MNLIVWWLFVFAVFKLKETFSHSSCLDVLSARVQQTFRFCGLTKQSIRTEICAEVALGVKSVLVFLTFPVCFIFLLRTLALTRPTVYVVCLFVFARVCVF